MHLLGVKLVITRRSQVYRPNHYTTEPTVTLKVSKPRYKIYYYFIGSTSTFQFLYINILNYHYFHTEIKKNVGKIKKASKRIFMENKIKSFINVDYNFGVY